MRCWNFHARWDGKQPFLIHCWAGISRSMASAFTILCDRLGPGCEAEIAKAMRRRAPHAQPNRLLVRHADEALGRGGAMLAAVEAMGPPLLRGRRRHHAFSVGEPVSAQKENVSIGLSAAILAVEGERPSVLVVAHDGSLDALPFGPFDPVQHRTLESGLRQWVGEQTGFELGYTEQLYTFGDKGRHLSAPGGGRVVSVGYLALTRQTSTSSARRQAREWHGWYQYFPWEDWRDQKPAMIDSVILPALKKFVKDAPGRTWRTAPRAGQSLFRRRLGRGTGAGAL